MGDYHALPSAQRFCATLLAEVYRKSKRVILAVEMVLGRNQIDLDLWLEEAIDDEELKRRIRYDMEWGFGWEEEKRLLEVARERRIPVIAVDCEPRNDLRKIHRRDRYIAQQICNIFEVYPQAKVFVLIGESHLADGHLPAKTRETLHKRNMEKRDLTIVQNVDAIYWKIKEKGHEFFDVARLGPDKFCVFNATPLEKYEAYGQTLERWEHESSDDTELDLAPTVYRIINTILDFLKIDRYTYWIERVGLYTQYLIDVYPTVHSTSTYQIVERRINDIELPDLQRDWVLAHMKERGSCYIPTINTIFLGECRLVDAGEEAAHFVSHALKRLVYKDQPDSRLQYEAFYSDVLEEAVGFFGSKLVEPGRNHFFETEFYQYYRKDKEIIEAKTPYSFEEFNRIINFILLHKKFEKTYHEYDRIPEQLLSGISSSGDFYRIITHQLGYFLGQQIYDGFHRGRLSRREILALFTETYDSPDQPLRVYLDLVEKLSDETG